MFSQTFRKASFLPVAAITFFLNHSANATSPVENKVFFVEPKDGATVLSPVQIVFGLTGKTVKPAGGNPDDKTSGHHHLIIDGGFIPEGQVIPASATHIHYGKGQTEDTVKLAKGKHKLTLQFADGAHRSYGEPLSATITINVK